MNGKCFIILLLFSLSFGGLTSGITYSYMKNEQMMMKEISTKNCTAAALEGTGETLTSWKETTSKKWDAAKDYSVKKWDGTKKAVSDFWKNWREKKDLKKDENILDKQF